MSEVRRGKVSELYVRQFHYCSFSYRKCYNYVFENEYMIASNTRAGCVNY